MRSRLFKKESGFTLIELMIVIAIICILDAIAIPNFISYIFKSFCSYAEQDAGSVAAGIASYFATPAHTNLPTLLNLTAAGAAGENVSTNNATISITETNGVTTIIVSDGSGRCPAGVSFHKTLGGAQGSWQ